MDNQNKIEVPTPDMIWAILMENSTQLQESRKQLEESRKQLEETKMILDEKFRETDEKILESDKKTNQKIDRVSEQIGGLSKSLGEQTEYFFYSGIKKEMTLVGENFHTITKKVRGIHGWEYDIVLTNNRKVCVLEVKHKFEKKHLQRFLNDKIPNFKVEFPQYAEYEIVPAIASLHFLENTIELAHASNVLVLSREGKGIVRL